MALHFKSPLDRLIPVLAMVVTLTAANLHAGGSNRNGNPFGNGTFFQTTGTFSAVIRGQNLSGTMLFSTGASTNGVTTNSSGSCVISYLGNSEEGVAPGVYNGNASGIWNPSSGNISGQFWGGYTLSGTNSAIIWSQIYNSNNFPVAVEIRSNTIINGVVIETTNTIYIEPIGNNVFKNSVFMNGSFNGSVQNSYPNQTFSAQGMVSQQQLYPPPQDGTEGSIPVQMAAPLPISVTVQGIRVANEYTSYTTISNAIPYSMTTYTATNIPNQQGGLGGQ